MSESQEISGDDVAPVRSLGTNVVVGAGATAEVNAPRQVTLYSRLTGDEVGIYPEAKANDLMREMPQLTPVKWDVNACETELLSAIEVLGPVTQQMIAARQRLGYVPEANDASIQLAFGAVSRAARNYSMALGATVPTEAEVRDWGEHQKVVGTKDESYPYRRDADGKQLEADLTIGEFSQYPNLERARRNQVAIDAYTAEHGGH